MSCHASLVALVPAVGGEAPRRLYFADSTCLQLRSVQHTTMYPRESLTASDYQGSDRERTRGVPRVICSRASLRA